MQGIPYYQRAKFGLSRASIETMITDLPLKQQLFAETGVYRFLFLVFSFLIKNSQVESYSCLLFKSGGEKKHVKTCNLFPPKLACGSKCQVPMFSFYQAGQQKSLDFSCSSRQTINRSALAPLFLGNGSGMMKAGTPSTKLMDISEKVLRWLGERAKGRQG